MKGSKHLLGLQGSESALTNVFPYERADKVAAVGLMRTQGRRNGPVAAHQRRHSFSPTRSRGAADIVKQPRPIARRNSHKKLVNGLGP